MPEQIFCAGLPKAEDAEEKEAEREKVKIKKKK